MQGEYRSARGGGVLDLMHGRSHMSIDPLASLQYWDGARRVFTEQADVACTKREAPRGVGRVARRESCILYQYPLFEVDFLEYG